MSRVLLKQFQIAIALIAVSASVSSGCSSQVPNDPVPKHETFQIASELLGETRVICVWTPPNYSKSNSNLPVLYMPDGGIQEDFPHIANTISKLVEKNDIAPLILVGIENTERRRDLTGPSKVESDAKIAPVTDGASEFRKFIQAELFPEIAKRYRINGERAIVGESAAGLFVVETLFLKPELFDVYIAMDPALHWNDHELVRKASERLSKFPSSRIKLWFAGSDAQDILPHTDGLSDQLSDHAPDSLEWHYSRQPGEHHNTIFRATKAAAFKRSLWSPMNQDK